MEEDYFTIIEKKLEMRQLEKLDDKSHRERIQQFNQLFENYASIVRWEQDEFELSPISFL